MSNPEEYLERDYTHKPDHAAHVTMSTRNTVVSVDNPDNRRKSTVSAIEGSGDLNEGHSLETLAEEMREGNIEKANKLADLTDTDLELAWKAIADKPGDYQRKMMRASNARYLVIMEMRRREYSWGQMEVIGGITRATIKMAATKEERKIARRKANERRKVLAERMDRIERD